MMGFQEKNILEFPIISRHWDGEGNRRESHTQMRALLAACRELAGDYNRLLEVLYAFEPKG